MPTQIISLRYGCALISLLLLLAFGGEAFRPAPATARSVPLSGAARTLPPGARVLGPLPAGHPLRLIVGLAPRHADVLDALVQARRAAHLPIMTPGQFAALFSPTPAAYAVVAAYLRAHGLRIVRTYPDRLLLDVAGTAGHVAAAFGTPLVCYRDRYGQRHYANASAPRLPPDLAALVTSVIGLRDDGALHHSPLPRLWRLAGPGSAAQVHGVRSQASLPPASMLTPAQLLAAYDIMPMYSAVVTATNGVSTTVSITGAGQTIALYELSPYNPADIAAYDAAFGLTATAPISIPVDSGATNTFGGTGAAEVALDIEMVHAVAPGAQVLVYSGPASPNSTDTTGADDTYARIVNDNRAQVLSTSWGQCEPDQQADTPPDTTLLHNLFAQAVAEGMTVVAASGDAGANDCTDGKPNPSVDYPASDPAVLAVGGSTLNLDSAGAVQSETGWAGSGGGASAVWPRSAWQSGPGVPAGTQRAVPDVALDAGRPYAVWVTGGWTGVSGTSAGPPVWGAILALVNQLRYASAQAQGAPTPAPCAVQPGLGDIHPELYQLGAAPGATPAMRDITTGASNGVAPPGPGWDPVTGWGVPNGAALEKALLAQPQLAAPTPSPCHTPAHVPTATSTPVLPSATPTQQAATSVPTLRAGTPTAHPSPTAMRSPAPVKSILSLRAVPATVPVGGIVVLQLRGVPGPQQSAVFELRYPSQKVQRLLRTTDAHGAATVRVRVMQVTLHGRPLTVWLRVTVRDRRHVLVGWSSFRIVPASTAHGHSARGRRPPARGCAGAYRTRRAQACTAGAPKR